MRKELPGIIKGVFITIVSLFAVLVFGLFLYYNFYSPRLSENYGKVDAKLFVSESVNQPLIVAFGGSQGGNTWTEDYWAAIRNRFLQQDYAVLSIGYFNTENTPETLDRISINAIYDTIKKASTHPKIDKNKIALLGSSRGGELVLNIASRYKDIDAVVALVPSNVSFSALTPTTNTSAWTYNNKEIPFIKIPLKAIWASIQGDSQRSWKIIFGNEKSYVRSAIEVEKINGPILLISAEDDEIWPSKYMSDEIVGRLRENQFEYFFEHLSFKGGHNDIKNHFDVVFGFFDEHFK